MEIAQVRRPHPVLTNEPSKKVATSWTVILELNFIFLIFDFYQLHHQERNMVECQIRERREPQENPTGHIRVSCSFAAFNQESCFMDGHGCAAFLYIVFFLPFLVQKQLFSFFQLKKETIPSEMFSHQSFLFCDMLFLL